MPSKRTRRRNDMRKRFLAYVRIITHYARDRDRSMGVNKRALLLYVCAPYVRTYAYIIINAHARTKTETREQNETARDRIGRHTPVKRHGTARKLQLFIDVYCIFHLMCTNSASHTHAFYISLLLFHISLKAQRVLHFSVSLVMQRGHYQV